jgi:hypothetical protein
VADSSVAVTPGAGATVDTYAVAGGDHQQVVREARATAVGALNTWTVTTAGVQNQIAADAGRVAVLIESAANTRVYLRFDGTIPTAAAHHWFLDPGDRWEVPVQLSTLTVSMAGAGAGGTILSTLATAS